jgi:hypothetical protein
MKSATRTYPANAAASGCVQTVESLRHGPKENENNDDWDDLGPFPDEDGWDGDPFADAEEAEPEYGDFWPEEDDLDD